MKILCDSNIFIHLFNDDPKTTAELQKIGDENVLISSISVMELYRGMGNKQEMAEMVKKLKHYNVVHFDQATSRKAVELVRDFKLSHDLRIPDAIIGAMAITFQIPLFTYNRKDFQFMPGIILYETV